MKVKIVLFFIFIIVLTTSILVINRFASPERITPPSIDESIVVRQIESAQGTYLGETISFIYQGFGEFTFLSGEKHLGSWDNSQMSGNGSTIFPGIGQYVGEYSGGVRSGRGTFTWFDGDIYDGKWQNDSMSGEGTYTFSSGATMEGFFTNNTIMYGRYNYVTEVYDDGMRVTIFLTVEISEGNFSDTIEFRTSSGLIYIGGFPKADSEVPAEITYPDGNRYTGVLINGKRSGEGVFTWMNSTYGPRECAYNGEWANDLMNGEGVYYYGVLDYPRLEGTFENGIPTGTCVYFKDERFSYVTVWTDGICTSIVEQ